MTSVFDVIVVGAGPAGATTAARLASDGLDVLILEKSQFPRDKPCGGGLSPKAYRLLDVDIADLVRARPRRVVLRAPGTGPVAVEATSGAIWMVQRPDFDQRLLDDALNRGARVVNPAIVNSVELAGGERDLATVSTTSGDYRARVVVGADGSDSVVARSAALRLSRERRYTLALEAEIPMPRTGSDSDAIIDFGMRRGYGWLFPKGDVCNVGVGTDDRRQFRDLRNLLAEFLQRNRIELGPGVRVVGHKIPTWSGPEQLHRGNVLLVGDAAGVADPFFGEGIAYAIQTGIFASTTISRYCAGDFADLSDYTRSVQSILGRDLRFWSILASVVYRWPSLAVRVLTASSRLQLLADHAISGQKSFSRSWKR